MLANALDGMIQMMPPVAHVRPETEEDLRSMTIRRSVPARHAVAILSINAVLTVSVRRLRSTRMAKLWQPATTRLRGRSRRVTPSTLFPNAGEQSTGPLDSRKQPPTHRFLSHAEPRSESTRDIELPRTHRSTITSSGAIALALILAACLAACGTSKAVTPSHNPRVLIHLPHDAAMHPSAQTEWWYVVGHLVGPGGRRFGFETTVFKLHHVRVSRLNQTISLDRTDVALSDLGGHRFLPTVSYILPGSGTPVRLSSTSFSERAGGLLLFGSPGTMHLQASTHGYRMRLTLTSHRPALLEGGSGLVPMGSRGHSYYYSQTDLAVRGDIAPGSTAIPVHGIAWLDHQWGSWDWSQIRGWTWGAFQMTNGVDFSISDFHAVGRSLHGVSVSFSNVKSRVVRSVSIRATGKWLSPHDRARYPSGWVVSIPQLRARLLVTPLLRDQEMYDRLNPSMSYWEGACSVHGMFEGRTISGQAYMELVGFAGQFGTL